MAISESELHIHQLLEKLRKRIAADYSDAEIDHFKQNGNCEEICRKYDPAQGQHDFAEAVRRFCAETTFEPALK